MSLATRIFQIGFNRCGTRTLAAYLIANGIRTVHWDRGRLARRVFANLANGEELTGGYESFDAFTDMEYLDERVHLEAYKLFPYFAERYPAAIFILNTRDRESWLKSRLNHRAGEYALRYKRYLGVGSDARLLQIWREEWERHHDRVIRFFASRNHRFFICRIETDLPELLHKQIPEHTWNSAVYRVEAGRLQGKPAGSGSS